MRQETAPRAAEKSASVQRPTTNPSCPLPACGPPQFTYGVSVRIEGLVQAAHLNGMTGTLRNFDHDALRWFVELPNGETKAVKPENLLAVAPVSPSKLSQISQSATNGRAAK